MRRFSEELVEDREFEIGGELFKWRYPYWEEYADQLDSDLAEVKLLQERAKETNGDDPVAAETVRSAWQSYIDRIPMFLDPENDSVKRFKTLTKRKTNPVPHYMYRELYEWLVEVSSGRPTVQPSPSENGPGQTDSTSQEGSS